MSDLISRQDAIDAIQKNTFRLTVAEEQNAEGHVAWNAYVVYSDAAEGALLELPSAQPTQTNAESNTESTQDCISRRKVYDAVDCMRFASDAERRYGFSLLEQIPTAEPERKKGKWIPTQNPQWKAYYHDKCSVCGWWNTKNAVCRDSKKKARSLNYCPNCGARMESEEQ